MISQLVNYAVDSGAVARQGLCRLELRIRPKHQNLERNSTSNHGSVDEVL